MQFHRAKQNRSRVVYRGPNRGAAFQRHTAGTLCANVDETVALFIEASVAGDAEASSFIGTMYENGKGVPHDHKKAVAFYTTVACSPESGPS